MTDDKTINVNFRRADYERIEDWRRAQPEIPTLAATIRAFVIQGLDDAHHPNASTTA